MKILINIISIFVLSVSGGYSQVPYEYIKMAAENNPELKASYREFEAALERIPQAKSLPDPILMAGYTVWPSESMPGMEKARVSLNQMFPWFGNLKAMGDEATLQAESHYQNFIDLRNNLYFQVAVAWYPLYEVNKFRQIEQENIGILNSYKNIATRIFENGTGSMVDVLRADIMLKDAQTRLSLLDDREESLMAIFNNLLNRREDEAVKIPDTLYIENPVPGFNRDSLLTHNPRLKELDLKYRASEIKREVARRQGLPNIGVGLEYMRMEMQPDMGSPGRTKGALMPMVSMSLPLYRGKYKAAQEEARLMQDSYAQQMENTLNKIGRAHV